MRNVRVPGAGCWVLRADSVALRAVLGAVLVLATHVASAQPTPIPVVRVSFAEAIQRAQERNPTVAQAAAGILRAEGLVQQARAASTFQLSGNVVSTTLNRGVEFDDATVTPRSQLTAALSASMPILAAAAWARRTQAQDTKAIAELNVADIKRQVAFATADAYLAILASRRVVETNVLARDTAKAHFDLATELEQRGTGSRLNTLRAQQQYSSDSGLVEVALLALYRAQEALGVLIVADGPADATDEPDFVSQAAPSVATFSTTNLVRTDLRLLAAQQQAADRVLRDSKLDWYPTVDATFQPSTTYPAQFFLPQNSWRLLVQANIPIFDSGLRASERVQRRADVEQFTATLSRGVIEANAQVRAAREAVASGGRTLAAARDAADQAQQVVNITNISFRAGAATNIEVIDAERVARNAGTAVAVAEDQLRRAQLDLLDALGRFP